MTLQEKADKLLKKRKLTGHDVGALLLDSFRAYIEDNGGQVNADIFAALEARVYQDKTEGAIYGLYRDIYLQFSQTYKKTSEILRQFTASFTPDITLNEFIENEKAYNVTEKIPLIVTREEYRAIIEKAKKNITTNRPAAYYSMLEYIRAWSNRPELNPKIKNAVKKYRKMSPALNKRYGSLFLQPIYKVDGKEFNSLQDPIFISSKKARALEVIGSEDLEAYDAYIADKKKELLYKGPAAIRDYMRKARKTALISLTDDELISRLDTSLKVDPNIFYLSPDYIALENALAFNPVVEYCGQSLDKYQEGRSYFDLLCMYTEGPIDKDLPAKIKEDYPALAAAIDSYLEEEAAADFPTLPSYFPALLSFSYNNRPDVLERINTAGIAVNMDPATTARAPEPSMFFKLTPHKYSAKEKSLKVFEPLAYMNCYNTTITLLAEVFDVPGILEFALFTVPEWEEYREHFNRVLYHTNYLLEDFYTGERLKEKRQALRGLFPFDYLRSASDFLPSKKEVKEVKEDLIELRDTRDPAGRLRIMETITIRRLLESVKL